MAYESSKLEEPWMCHLNLSSFLSGTHTQKKVQTTQILFQASHLRYVNQGPLDGVGGVSNAFPIWTRPSPDLSFLSFSGLPDLGWI